MSDSTDHSLPDLEIEAHRTSAYDTWERERDLRLAHFLQNLMQEVEMDACPEERQALFWIVNVLSGWQKSRTANFVDPLTVAWADTVGWILRMVAHTRWHRHPDWLADFHPQAVGPFSEGEADGT
ncbi:hypothetical protein [Streptomyces sp. NPDC048508]|uniref:hypothetical protein n=1 Tax=Streptomyces sp. NPDC048508 TaxID=3365561 RepID=UPI0037133BC0